EPQISEPDVDRYRGNDPRAADGRSRAHGRLRQDRTGAAHGRGVRRPAGGHAGGGPYDDGASPARAARRLPRLPSFLGALARGGRAAEEEISEVEAELAVTAGTCGVMGPASTMACIAEALGLVLPGTAAIPAVHSDRLRAAEATGAAAVRLIGSNRTPDQIVNAKSVENALRALLALGGSTNAVIHLTAIAGRVGVKVSLEQLNKLSDTTPVLVNLKPVGNGYMEDFFASGGMGALLRELKPQLHLDCMTVTGETLGERLASDAAFYVDRSIIAGRDKPFEPQGGLVALFGNLA